MRVSKIGFDALTEPLNSKNIPLDTNVDFIGAVVAHGLVQCGGATISFPEMPYVPIVFIMPWDGTYLSTYSIQNFGSPVAHQWIPAVAIVTTSSLLVRRFETPFYNPGTFYEPNGTWFAYNVFAFG